MSAVQSERPDSFTVYKDRGRVGIQLRSRANGARTSRGALIELTGDAPKIILGSTTAPVCELSLDRTTGQLLSTCIIADPAASNVRQLTTDGVTATNDACSSCATRLAALEAEVAALRAALNP
jgi:hypothetical protein